MVSRAFALFELVIVIAIIIFLTSLTLNFIIISDSTFVKLELEKIYSYCLYLQKQAQIKQEIQYLNIGQNFYKISDKIIKLDPRVKFDIINGVKGPPSWPSSYLSNSNTFKNSVICFYPDGIISSGTIYLTDKNNKKLYALSSSIGQVSYLRKYKFDKNWNCL